MALTGGATLFFGVWVLAGAMTILSALCYAEMVAMLPRSGGPYAYLKAAYPPWWAFLRGWAMFFVSETATIAAVALVFAEYARTLGRRRAAGRFGRAVSRPPRPPAGSGC